ncbi:uncharacterized protein [Ptychodera flava]|uniref:uncharacterized protein n=1 Tax=Ptychodera flava TaxID=63121 RepID=UPI00396A5B33
MGVFQHLGLLLWKNLKLRLRAPILTGIQLLWPIALFVVVAVLRKQNPPIAEEQCHYNAKGMPSSGLMPFMQSFMCDMQNECQRNMTTPSNEIPVYAGAQISNILEEFKPLVANDTLMAQLKNLSINVEPINELTRTINKAVQNLTGKDYRVRDILKDPEYVKSYLIEETGASEQVIDVFLNATININRIFDLLAGFSFKEIACNETELTTYLEFQEDTNVTRVVESLCNVTDSQIPSLVDELQEQLDVKYLLTEFSDLLTLFGKYNWDKLMNDLATMLEGVGDISDIGQLLEDFPKLLDFVDIIPKLQELFDVFSSGLLDLESAIFKHVIDTFDDVFGNATQWFDVRNGIRQIGVLVEFFNEKIDETRGQGGEIVLLDLFRNSSDFTRFLDKHFAQAPAIVDAWLQAAISPDKLRILITSPEQLVATLCDPVSLAEIFFFPEDVEVDYVRDTLCTMNATQLLDELWRLMDMTLVVQELTKYDGRSDILFEVDWIELYDKVRVLEDNIRSVPPEILENIPQFIESLLRLNLGEWHEVAEGIRNTNTTLDWWMERGTGLTVQLFEELLKNSQLWPILQKIAILENLALDIARLVIDNFTGERYCPENWMKSHTSCYLPMQEQMTMTEANSHCDSMLTGSHLVVVETREEQALLQTMEISYTTWIGAMSDSDQDHWVWLNGENLVYEKWAAETLIGDCAVANFHGDGEWHKRNCTLVAEGFICEARQGPAIMNFMMEDPFVQMIDDVMELGPIVTETIITTFTSSDVIQDMVSRGQMNLTNIFCEDYIKYPDTVNVTAVKDALCGIDLQELMDEFMLKWNVEEILAKVAMFQEVWSTDPTELKEEHLVHANFTALFVRALKLIDDMTEMATYPIDLNSIFMDLLKDVDVNGIMQVMENQLMAWQQPMNLDESLSLVMQSITSGFESNEYWAIMQPMLTYSHYMMMAMNKYFVMVEALSHGEVFTDQPEVTKLMTGVMEIMKQPVDFMAPLMAGVMNPDMLMAISDLASVEDLFCDADKRQQMFDFPPSANVAVFDLYLCDINITILSDELAQEFFAPEMAEQMAKISYVMIGNITTSVGPFDWEVYIETAQTLFNNMNRLGNITMDVVKYYDLVSSMETLASMNVSMLSLLMPQEMTTEELMETINNMAGQVLDQLAPLFLPMSVDVTTPHLIIKMINRHFEIMEGFEENKMLVNGTELVKLYTTLHHVMNNIQEVMKAMMMTMLNPQKIEMLFEVDDWLEVFCDLQFRQNVFMLDSSFNFTVIDDNLCTIDWEALLEEMKKEMYVGELIRQFLGPPNIGNSTNVIRTNTTYVTFSWRQYFEDMNELNGNVEGVMLMTTALFDKINITTIINEVSRGLMQRYLPLLNGDVETIIPVVLVSVLPMLEQTEMWSQYDPLFKTIHNMVDSVNQQLEMFSGYIDGDVHFDNADLTRLYDGVYLMIQDAPLVLDAVIDTVSDPSKAAVISQVVDWYKAFCDPSRRSQLLNLPPSFNTSIFDDYLCKVNYSSLMGSTDYPQIAEFAAQIMNLQNILHGVPVNVSSDPINWEAFLISILHLSENAMAFSNRSVQMFQGYNMTALKGLVTEGMERAENNYMELLNSGWRMIPMTGRLYGEMLEQSEAWAMTEPMFNLCNALMEAVNAHFELWKASPADGMASIIGNETRTFLHGVHGIMQQFPDILRAMLEAVMDPQKSAALSTQAIDDVFCDDGVRNYFFEFPPSTDLSFLDDLCQVDYPVLMEELKVRHHVQDIETEIFKLNQIRSGVRPNASGNAFDWDALISNVQEFTDNVMMLPNMTMAWQTQYNWTEIIRVMQMAFVDMQMENILNTDNWVEILAQSMATVDSTMVDNPAWNEIKHQIAMYHYGYKYLNGRLDEILENGLTVDSLFRNSTIFTELMQESAEILPDLIDASVIFISNPQAMMQIIMTENWNELLCDADQLKGLLGLQDSSQVMSLQRIICDTPPEGFMYDLLKNRDIAELAEQIDKLFVNTSKAIEVDWLDFFRSLEEYSIKLGMMENFNGPIFPSIPYSKLMNETFWNRKMENILGSLPMPDTLDWLDLLAGTTSMMENILGDNAAWNEIKVSLKMYYYIYKYLNGRLDDILENGLTLDTFYENATIYIDLIQKSVELLPDLVDASLTIIRQPEKMISIIQSPHWNDTLCDPDNLKELLGLQDTSDIAALQRILCGSSLDALMNDLLKNKHIAELAEQLEALLSNTSRPVEIDWIDYFRTFEEYVTVLEKLQNFSGPIFPSLPEFTMNVTFWENKINEIVFRLDLADTGSWLNLFAGSTRMIEDILRDNAAWNEIKLSLKTNYYIYKYINGRVDDILENGLTLGSLFENATMYIELIQKSAELLPDLIDASLIFVTQAEKMIAIIQSPNWNETLCDHVQLREVLGLPDTSDIAAIQRILCRSSQEDFINDLLNNRHIAELASQLEELMSDTSTPVEIDWIDYFRTFEEYVTVLEKLQNFSGPIFPSLPGFTMNVTFWEKKKNDIVSRLDLADTGSWLDLLAGSTGMIEDILRDNAAWNEIKLSLKTNYYIYKYINGRVDDILENGLTLGSLFENATIYMELIQKSTELLPDLIDASLIFVTQPEKMIAIIQSPNWNETLCDHVQLREVLGLPDTSDIAAIQRILCRSSQEDFINDLLNNRHIAELVSQLEELMSDTSTPVELDWIDYFRTFEEYVTVLEKLQNFSGPIFPSLPEFTMNVTFWENKINDIVSRLDLADTGSWLDLLAGSTGMIEDILRDNAAWNEIKLSLKTNYYIYKYINGRVDDILENGLTLSSLFENATIYMELIQKAAELLPDLIDASLIFVTQPEKMIAIIQSPNWNETLCDPVQLREVLGLPDTSDIAAIQRILCRSSQDDFINDLLSNRHIAELASQLEELMSDTSTPVEIDWIDYFRTFEEYVTVLEKLQNFSGPIYPSLPGFTMNGTFWENKINEIVSRLDLADTGSWLDLLAGSTGMIEDILRDNAAWNDVKLSLKTNYYIYKYINGRVDDILENGLTLGSLFENATIYMELIQKSAELLPDLIDASLIFVTQPEKMIDIIQSPNWNETLCDPVQIREVLGLPDTSDIAAIQRILCRSSQEDFINDLLNNRHIAELVSQLEELMSDTSAPVEIDWIDYFRTFEEYVTVLEKLQNFSGPIFPSLPGFTMNVTFWENKINDVISQFAVPQTDTWLALLARSGGLVDDMLIDSALWNTIKANMKISYYAYQYANKIMEQIMDNGITIETLLKNATVSLELIHNTAALLPELIDTTMILLTQPERMVGIIMSPDWNETLCDPVKLGEALDLPDTTELSAVQRIVCSINPEQLMFDLLRNGHIAELAVQVASLMNASRTVEINWPDFIMTIQDYATNLQRLQSFNGPVFPSLSLSIMNATFWEVQLRNILARFAMPDTNELLELISKNLGLVDDFVGDNSAWNEVKGQLNVYYFVYKYINDRLDDILDNGLTLDMLHKDAPMFMEMIQKSSEVLPDLIDGTLTLLTQSEKLIGIVMSTDWNDTLCNPATLQETFGLPNSTHITSIQQILCGTTGEDLISELQKGEGIPELLEQIGGVMNSSKQVQIDWLDFFKTLEEYSRKVEQLMNFNGPIYPSLQAFSVNETFWNVKISQILRRLQMPATADWLDALAANVAEIDQLVSNNTAWNNVKGNLNVFLDLYKYVNGRLENIMENGLTLDSIYQNASAYAELLKDSADLLPKLIDASLAIVTQPEKIVNMISSGAINVTLCGPSDLAAFFDLPEIANLTTLQRLLCGITTDDFLSSLFGNDDVIELLNQISQPQRYNVSQVELDWTDYLRTIEEAAVRFEMMQNLTGPIIPSLPAFLVNGTFWDVKINDIIQSLSTPDTNTWLDLIGSNIGLFDSIFADNEVWNQLKAQVGMQYYIVKYISGRLDEIMENGLTLNSLFENATIYIDLIQKSSEVLPSLIEASVVMGTQPDKIIEIILSEDWNTTLCDPAKLKAMFNLTDDIKVESMQRILCQTSYEQLMYDLLKNEDIADLIDKVTRLLGNESMSVELDWQDLIMTMQEYSNKLMELGNSDVSIFPSLPQDTMNGTLWNSLLSRMLGRLQMPNTDDLLNVLAQNLGIVANMLPDSAPWNEIKNNFQVNYYIMKYINGRLEEIMDEGLTLDSLYKNATIYNEMFRRSAELLPDLIEASLSILTQPEKLLDIILSGKWNETLCAPNKLREIFNFPDTSNITALQSLLCQSTSNDYMYDLLKNGDISDLVDQLNDLLGNTTTAQIDWLDYMRTMQEYVTRLQMLQNFDGSIYPSLPVFVMNGTFWDITLPNILSRLQMPVTTGWIEQVGALLDMMEANWQNNTIWNEVKTNMKLSYYMYKFFNAKVDDVMENGLTFDLLFKNATLYIELLQTTATTLPNLVEAFFTIVTQPDKLAKVISSGKWNETLCDADDLSDEFGFHDGLDISPVQNLLCSFNNEAFMVDLLRNRQIAELIENIQKLYMDTDEADQFSWVDFLKTMEEYLTKVMELENSRVPIFPSLPQSLMNGTIWNIKLQEMIARSNMPTDNNYVDAVAFMLDGIDAMLADSTEWNNVLKQFYSANAILEFTNAKMRQMLDEGLTLDVLYKNTTFYGDYFKLSATFLPDIIQAALTMMTNPQKLVQLIISGQLNTTFCDEMALRNSFTFPESVNVTVVTRVFCLPMDVDFLLMDLLRNKDIADLLRESMRYSEDDGGPVNFSWQEFSYNLREYMVLLEAMMNFTGPVFPSVPGFIFNGTLFFDQIEAALDPLSAFENLESLADIMAALDNMFHNDPVWQEALKIMQITNVIMNPVNDLLRRISETEEIVLPRIGDLFVDAKEVRKALRAFNIAPDLTEFFMGLLIHPDKLLTLIFTPEPFATLCKNGIFQSFFAVPADAEYNITAIEHYICNTNFTVIEHEIMKMIDAEKIMSEITMILQSPSQNVNWTAYAIRNGHLIDTIDRLISFPPTLTIDQPWLNSTTMALVNIFMKFAVSINSNQTLMNYYKAFQMLDDNREMIQNSELWNELRPTLITIDWLIEYLNRRIENIPGTNVTFGEIFPKSIAEYLEKSGQFSTEIVDAIKQVTVDPGKIYALLMSTDSYNMICQNDTVFGDVFGLQVEVNGSAIRQVICSVDQVVWMNELISEFNIDDLMTRLNSTDEHTPFSWTTMFMNLLSLINNAEKLMARPIGFSQGEQWVDDAMQDLENMIESLSSALDADAQSIGRLVQTVSRLFLDTSVLNDMQPILDIYSALVKSMNSLLKNVEGMNLGSANILLDVQNLFSSILDPDSLQSLMEALSNMDAVSNSNMLQFFRLIGSSQSDICHNDTVFQNALSLPYGTDVEPLMDTLCPANGTSLVGQALERINILRLLTALSMGNQSESVGWTGSINETEKFIINLLELLDNPPTFTGFTAEDIERVMFNLVEWPDNEVLLQVVLRTFFSFVNIENNTISEEVARYVHISQSLMRFLNNKVDDLKVDAYGGIDISSLFMNSTLLQQLAQNGIYLAENLGEILQHTQFRPQKITEFIRLTPTQMTEVVCDPEKLQQYLILPSSVNVTTLISDLCQMDEEALMSDILKDMDIARLVSELNKYTQGLIDLDDFNLEDVAMKLYVSNMQLQDKINAMVESVREVSLGDKAISDIKPFDPSSILDNIMAMITENQDDQIQMLAVMLNGLNIELQDDPNWREIQRSMHIFRYFLDLSEKGLQALKDGELTLGELLGNQSGIFDLIQESLNVSPTIVRELLSASLNPAKILTLVDPMIWNNVTCHADSIREIFDFDSSINVTYLINALCGADFTTLAQQLSDEFNIEQIASLFDINYNPPAIDWTEMIGKVMELQGQLMDLTSANSAGSTFPLSILQNFLMAQGNISEDWRSLLNLLAGNMNEENLSGLSAILDKLYEILEQDLDTLPGISEMLPLNISSLIRHIEDMINSNLEDQPMLIARLLNNLSNDLKEVPMWSELQRYLHMLNYVIDLNQMVLEGMRDGDLTLGGLLTNQSEILLLMIESLEVAPEVAMDILQASLNFNKLFELMDPMKWDSIACDGSQLSELFDFGSSTNLTRVIDAICGANFTRLASHLANDFEVNKLLEIMTSIDTDLPNLDWANTISKVTNMYTTLLDLMSSNGPFQTYLSKWQGILTMNNMDINDLLNSVSSLVGVNMTAVNPDGLGGLLNDLNSQLEDNPVWNEVQRAIHILSYFLDLSEKGLHAIKDGELNLADFLGNGSEIVSWMEETLKVSPAIVQELLTTSLNPEKVLSLVDPSTWENLACDAESLKVIFDFGSSANITNLIDALCGANFTILAQNLADEFDVDRVLPLTY